MAGAMYCGVDLSIAGAAMDKYGIAGDVEGFARALRYYMDNIDGGRRDVILLMDVLRLVNDPAISAEDITKRADVMIGWLTKEE